MNLSNAKSTIYQWVAQELPLIQWRFAEQNSPSFVLSQYPNGIGTIKLLSTVNSGRGRIDTDYNAINDDFDVEYHGLKELVFSINIYGDNALDKAEQLRNSVNFPVYTEKFQSRNIGYIASTGVRDITQLISAQYETRAQFDIRFYTTVEYDKTVERIVEVNVKGDIEDGRIKTNQNITI